MNQSCRTGGFFCRLQRRYKRRYFYPLLGFVLPTLIIGYGVVIPHSCIAGINPPTIGFASSILNACITYFMGIRAVIQDKKENYNEKA
jgi:hypothetical protein